MALAGVAFLQTRVEGFEFGRGGGGGEDRAIMTDGGRVGGVYAWTVFVGGVVDAQQGAEVCVRVYYSGWGCGTRYVQVASIDDCWLLWL